MAVRFSADGQDYTSASTAIAPPLTALCWGKVVVDRNAFSTFFCLDDNTTSKTLLSQTFSDGVRIQGYSDPNARFADGVTAVVGDWYKIALVVNAGGNSALYTAPAGAPLTTATLSGLVTASGLTTFRIGESVFGGEWLNGCIANVKVYSDILTVAEIETELAYWSAIRTANLVRHHKLLTASTVDDSGNGRTLSGGTGAVTDTNDPPITDVSTAALQLPIQPIQVP